MDKTFFLKVASVISILGHPLLLMAITTTLIAFQLYDFTHALVIASVIILIVIVPVTVHLFLKSRSNAYTNFDVSDRKQRQSFYRFGLVLLGIATVVLYFLPGAVEFFKGTLYAFLMMITSALVNLKVKASLHTSVAVYVAFSCSIFDVKLAVAMLTFAIGIAWSRLVLERHTTREVVIGSLIGATMVCY
jgi:hypothetical protein